jgi:hypothetical protein
MGAHGGVFHATSWLTKVTTKNQPQKVGAGKTAQRQTK